ncbi:MAG TPA: DNA polymerase III subunit gamma/tau, partial [Persephonella sp.]|nr:DNA polymerase III subunit gamma/tau [Persephonella sp.]
MAYESFARKYRPKNFEEVVGQEAVVKTLSNAIKLDRLSHAYIFAGSRGLGKTTIARIITKCLNCEKGITDKPCGECENCREIEKGSFPDMYEIDAASNRGIDDIRSLRDNVSYAPIKGRYKVYIIDEAHMLTREAFNALLKTLEEPPPNNVFILATTELHKIPDTIRSRCQTFIFKPPSKSQIKEYLKRILEKEGIQYDEEALDLISNASEGGVRDAASILDQAVIYGSGEVKKETTQELLGVIPEEILKGFLKNLKEKNLKELVKTIERLDREGYDLTVFWNQITERIHKDLVSLVIGESTE